MVDGLTPEFVSVSFIDRATQQARHVQIRVPAGLIGREPRLTAACHDHAVDYGYTHWAQPYAREDAWAVFALAQGRSRTFIKKFPSRDAAEMWVLHHAD